MPKRRWLAAGAVAGGNWTIKAPLPKGRNGSAASAVMLSGQPRIHVIGGTRPGNNVAYIP